jgi:hypothetical protein
MDKKSIEWHEHKRKIYKNAKMYCAVEYETVIIEAMRARQVPVRKSQIQ